MSTTAKSDPEHHMGRWLTKFPPSRFRISFQQLVYHSVEIHQAGVLPQIIFRLPKKDVRLAIATSDGDFPRSRQRAHNLNFIVEDCKELGPKPVKKMRAD